MGSRGSKGGSAAHKNQKRRGAYLLQTLDVKCLMSNISKSISHKVSPEPANLKPET